MSLITFEEARKLIAERVQPLDTEELELTSSVGSFLAMGAISDCDLPSADMSAMDGYAMWYSDLETGVPLPLAHEIAAGDDAGSLEQGFCARIFTGAPLPEGADTVVQQEKATVNENGTVSFDLLEKGSHVRKRAEIFAAGDSLADAGREITPGLIASLAAGGVSRLACVRRPKIAIVVTGSELIEVNEPIQTGLTRNSNGPMLEAAVADSGFEIVGTRRASDDPDLLKEQLELAMNDADIVLITGGVSVGDYDFVPETLNESGAEIIFHRVFQKPGKPLLAAKRASTWILGLPGNPVSVLAGWRLYGLPLAQSLSGEKDAFSKDSVVAFTAEDVVNRGGRPSFLPGVLSFDNGHLSVEELKSQGSHDIVSIKDANTLFMIPEKSSIGTGSIVTCYPLSSNIGR